MAQQSFFGIVFFELRVSFLRVVGTYMRKWNGQQEVLDASRIDDKRTLKEDFWRETPVLTLMRRKVTPHGRLVFGLCASQHKHSVCFQRGPNNPVCIAIGFSSEFEEFFRKVA